MADGDLIGSGTPREVFYDDALLAEANLHPPTAVRVARDAGIDADPRPVTESELVSLLADAGGSDAKRPFSIDGGGRD